MGTNFSVNHGFQLSSLLKSNLYTSNCQRESPKRPSYFSSPKYKNVINNAESLTSASQSQQPGNHNKSSGLSGFNSVANSYFWFTRRFAGIFQAK